jgi:hypothetical protein
MSQARPCRGRAHETYGSYGKDPYLLSTLGRAHVRGLQVDDAATGVAATNGHRVGSSALRAASTPLWGSHKLPDLYAPGFEGRGRVTADCSR